MKKIIEMDYDDLVSSSEVFLEDPGKNCRFGVIDDGKGVCWKSVSLPHENNTINIAVDCENPKDCGLDSRSRVVGRAMTEDNRVYRIWSQRSGYEREDFSSSVGRGRALSITEILLIVLGVLIFIQVILNIRNC